MSEKTEPLPFPGRKVAGGSYTLLKVLGQGGMGLVWLARDERRGGEVALKFLPKHLRHDPVALNSLRREKTRSDTLNHPNIVRVYDLHESGSEELFITMEYVDGSTLVAHRIAQKTGVLSWEQLKPLLTQLCDALDHAHHQGIVHRDLKPGNVMITADGTVKLVDFGIASVIQDSVSRISGPLASGTPAYMSPQQINGDAPKTTDDIYSLGVTAYELLTGTPPFYRGEIVHQALHVQPQPLRQRLQELNLESSVPVHVETVIMSCLAKDAEKRPSSVRLVGQQLGVFIRQDNSSRTALAKKRSLLASGASVLCLSLFLLGIWFKKAGKSASPIVPSAGSKSIQVTHPPAWPPVRDNTFLETISNAGVRNVHVMEDGRLLITGWFDSINGMNRSSLARLNADGTLDSSFAPEFHDRTAYCQAVSLTENRALVLRVATSPSNRYWVGILNKDGKIMKTLLEGETPFIPYHITRQPDGKFYVCGNYKTGNDAKPTYIQRYFPDGRPDVEFNQRALPNRFVSKVLVQPDGKVVLAGSFHMLNGEDRLHVGRLLPGGDLDTAFVPERVLEKTPDLLAIQGDGCIYIGGSTSGSPPRRTNEVEIVRLLPNGQRDVSFKPSFWPDFNLKAICPLPDGHILLGGEMPPDHPRYIICLRQDGGEEIGFIQQKPGTSWISDIQATGDGRIYFGGGIKEFDGAPSGNVVRMLWKPPPVGVLSGGTKVIPAQKPGFHEVRTAGIRNIDQTTDGKIICGGWFESVDGTPRMGVARLLSDGNLDPGFVPELPKNIKVWNALALPEGNVLAFWEDLTPEATRQVAILDASGRLVKRVLQSPPRTKPYVVTRDGAGNIYVGGRFKTAPGKPDVSLLRYLPDGSPDEAFNSRVRVDSFVNTVTTQPDGCILLSGAFTEVNGRPRAYLARLMPDGTLDDHFVPDTDKVVGGGAGHVVPALDGSIYVTSDLYNPISTPEKGVTLVRLLPDGKLDKTFPTVRWTNFSARSLCPLPDGRLLVGGGRHPDHPRTLICLNPGGTEAGEFLPSHFSGGWVSALSLCATNELLVGGSFNSFGGQPCGQLLRFVVPTFQKMPPRPQIAAQTVPGPSKMQLVTRSNAEPDAEFIRLIEREDLSGWEFGNSGRWNCSNGILRCTHVGAPGSSAVMKSRNLELSDFEMRFSSRHAADAPQSGVTVRVRRHLPAGSSPLKSRNGEFSNDSALSYGFNVATRTSSRVFRIAEGDYALAKIGQSVRATEVDGRPSLEVVRLLGDVNALMRLYRPGEWNDYAIRCEGNRLQMWVNNVLTTELVDDAPQAHRSGSISLAVYNFLGQAEVAEFRDLRVKRLGGQEPAK